MPKRIAILGSTGSIGRNALDVIGRNPELFKVAVLAARGNVDLILQQARIFQPELVALYDPDAADRVRESLPGCRVVSGPAGLDEAGRYPVDVVLCALVGAVGLHPLLAAIEAGHRVAIANKEPLVMAGRFVMEEAARRGVQVLPVDSEHSAIFQCLQGHSLTDVRCIHLTASGGPFYRTPPERLRYITPREAACHPTWDMGRKISVDSATLMNKGLEIIEAMWLFGLRCGQIQVVIHPQSIVHSMVEFVDGSILAQLGVTDMRIPIALALSYPERLPAPDMRLDPASLSGLSFSVPDVQAFPCLSLARSAAEAGGTVPAVLNAANEIAVELFCAGRLPFMGIPDLVARTMDHCGGSEEYLLEAVLEADARARSYALSLAETME